MACLSCNPSTTGNEQITHAITDSCNSFLSVEKLASNEELYILHLALGNDRQMRQLATPCEYSDLNKSTQLEWRQILVKFVTTSHHLSIIKTVPP